MSNFLCKFLITYFNTSLSKSYRGLFFRGGYFRGSHQGCGKLIVFGFTKTNKARALSTVL